MKQKQKNTYMAIKTDTHHASDNHVSLTYHQNRQIPSVGQSCNTNVTIIQDTQHA